METGTVFIYDGNFQGFMTAVAEALEAGRPVQDLCRASRAQSALFARVRHVMSHRQKAETLWRSLERKGLSLQRLIYFAFLSEREGIELFIYNYLHLLFNPLEGDASRLPEWRQRLEQISRRVEMEKGELERDVPFQATRDGVLCAWVCPTHNCLPLLTRYFRNRHAGQSWLIYDARRNYGIRCHEGHLELVACRAEVLGPFVSLPDRQRLGDPELFGDLSLQSLLLPKVVEQRQATAARAPRPMRSAV